MLSIVKGLFDFNKRELERIHKEAMERVIRPENEIKE